MAMNGAADLAVVLRVRSETERALLPAFWAWVRGHRVEVNTGDSSALRYDWQATTAADAIESPHTAPAHARAVATPRRMARCRAVS